MCLGEGTLREERTGLVQPHELAVADHIDCQNSGETTLHDHPWSSLHQESNGVLDARLGHAFGGQPTLAWSVMGQIGHGSWMASSPIYLRKQTCRAADSQPEPNKTLANDLHGHGASRLLGLD